MRLSYVKDFFISYNLTTISLFEEEGVGHNYLIQHSAGSGKTKTIAEILNMVNSPFVGVCKKMRALPEIVDCFFFVLNTVSLPKLDGINDLLKEGLNNIFTDPHPNAVMRYSLFNSLVQKYESYLKKLYYLINDDEVEGQDGRDAMLADAVHAFRCLWKLVFLSLLSLFSIS